MLPSGKTVELKRAYLLANEAVSLPLPEEAAADTTLRINPASVYGFAVDAYDLPLQCHHPPLAHARRGMQDTHQTGPVRLPRTTLVAALASLVHAPVASADTGAQAIEFDRRALAARGLDPLWPNCSGMNRALHPVRTGSR